MALWAFFSNTLTKFHPFNVGIKTGTKTNVITSANNAYTKIITISSSCNPDFLTTNILSIFQLNKQSCNQNL